jgi:hypothetical protein
MNKLLIALLAGTFALISAAALADDSSVMPLSKMDTQQAKQARADAKAKWDKMTPEEQAAARKAARAKKQADQTALDAVAQEGSSIKYDPKAGAKDTTKVAKPTKEERQKDLKAQEKQSSGQ